MHGAGKAPSGWRVCSAPTLPDRKQDGRGNGKKIVYLSKRERNKSGNNILGGDKAQRVLGRGSSLLISGVTGEVT